MMPFDERSEKPRVQGHRAAWKSILNVLVMAHYERAVWVDETCVRSHMCRRYGYGPRGKRVRLKTRPRTKQYTMVCAMDVDGVVLRHVFPGKLDTSRWRAFVEELVDRLEGETRFVLWDNLNIHHDPGPISLLEQNSHIVLFTPPYSPEANPIEYMFSQLKSHLRAFNAQGAVALRAAVDRGLALIETQHILAFYLTAWGHALSWDA